MEPLTGEALEARIKELEEERDRLLAETPFVRYAPRKTSHSTIKTKYNRKITCLCKYGVEHSNQCKDVTAKMVASKRAKYGNGMGNVAKQRQTNLERYGNAWGNVAKSIETKRTKWGDSLSNINKMLETKQRLYGNAFGPKQKINATTLQRYGVPWFCMTKKCRDANGRPISAINKYWHDKLQQELFINCGYDEISLCRFSFDLNYSNEHCKLLIEINPTFSHNAAYGFAYAMGKSTHNCPYAFDYHFNKTQLALKHGYTCITIFEWMDDNEVIDTIRKHLAGEPVDSTDFALNPQLSDDKSTIRKHWHNFKTRQYAKDCGQDAQEMLDAGFLPVYDCGHAVQN